MSYLMFLEQVSRCMPVMAPITFLVSGNDELVRKSALADIFDRCRGKVVIILDDSGNPGMLSARDLEVAGYSVKNALSGKFSFYRDLLQIQHVKGMSRFRQALSLLDCGERQKLKMVAYLNFIRHLESLRAPHENMAPLDMEIIGAYSSNMLVERKLEALLAAGTIDCDQHMYLLGKYAEVCEAAADLEDALYLFAPFFTGETPLLGLEKSTAAVIRLADLGEDMVMKDIVVQMLLYALEDAKVPTTVVVLDRGAGDRRYLLRFLSALPEYTEAHLVSEDVFTLGDTSAVQMLANRFTAGVYSRHLAMASCFAIEQAMGDVDIVKRSYTVSYDRRWRANRPWDVLMGTNKTEEYIENPAVREPRYRKEMIASLPVGNGIVSYMGSSSLFVV